MANNPRVKKFAMLIHRLYKDGTVKRGGADYIFSYLTNLGCVPLLVEHPLENGGNTIVTDHLGQKKTFKLVGEGLVRWCQEVILNTFLLLKSKPDLIVAVDPLNFLPAYLARKRKGIRIIFHSIDYSEKRFNSALLNSLYHFFYRFAASNSDVVTYVSPKMGEEIKKMDPKSVVYLPNSPEFEKIPKLDPRQKLKKALVYTKSFISDSEVDLLLDIASSLEKTNKLDFHLVGVLSTKANDKIKKSAFSERFVLHGLLDYSKNVDVISNAYIGFAWYEGKKQFERYADSLKIREYAAAGLPCVCNDVVSTCFEMEKEGAGIIARNPKEAADSINSLIADEVLYNRLRAAALDWARRLDKNKMLEGLFSYVK